MLDHLSIPVRDIARSRQFYAAALEPLGYTLIKDMSFAVSFAVTEGYGESSDPGGEFWIYQSKGEPCPAVHFAFSAASRERVEAFFAAAMAVGGIDNGPPGLRPNYHRDYYAAFVRDPDGYNIEAVYHRQP
ncbi:VOC family protein [Pectobacterium parmentieri]|uniref:VOC family protein n=1 Tax=Pectobacterium parmentieri TaxID=1905730 RepID=UPI0018DFDE3D|nr:VOC family protein [Pectobacterium parmentieri]MBI0551592.1 VOC family protein [Pectobacterium parmentieri]MBI0564561.1 VOC family protein [Pectobacterium parmentieri]